MFNNNRLIMRFFEIIYICRLKILCFMRRAAFRKKKLYIINFNRPLYNAYLYLFKFVKKFDTLKVIVNKLNYV